MSVVPSSCGITRQHHHSLLNGLVHSPYFYLETYKSFAFINVNIRFSLIKVLFSGPVKVTEMKIRYYKNKI